MARWHCSSVLVWHVQINPCDSGYKNKTVNGKGIVAHIQSLLLRKLRQGDYCESKAILVTKQSPPPSIPKWRRMPLCVLQQCSIPSRACSCGERLAPACLPCVPEGIRHRGMCCQSRHRGVGSWLLDIQSSLGTNLLPETRKVFICKWPSLHIKLISCLSGEGGNAEALSPPQSLYWVTVYRCTTPA